MQIQLREVQQTDLYIVIPFPRHPVIFSDDDWGVQSASQRIVFRFHETILSFGEPGSLGYSKLRYQDGKWTDGNRPMVYLYLIYHRNQSNIPGRFHFNRDFYSPKSSILSSGFPLFSPSILGVKSPIFWVDIHLDLPVWVPGK